MAAEPQRHASTKDPSTWSDYATALAAVQAGHADGISYILTEQDSFAAIDIDNCRHLGNLRSTSGRRISWTSAATAMAKSRRAAPAAGSGGLANGEPLNRKFTLEIDGKPIAAELFRRTNKALTITGYTLDPAIKQLANIDKAIAWAVVWGERRKAAAAEAAAPVAGNGFDSDGCRYTIEQIEAMIRNGAPPGSDRSAVFHAIIGHLSGCGWDAERIFEHVGQFPDGIGAKYIAEGRLTAEIARSLGKYQAGELPLFSDGGWVNGWKAKQPEKAPAEEPELEEPQPSKVGVKSCSSIGEEVFTRSFDARVVEPEQDARVVEPDDDLDEELEDEDLPPADPNLPPLYAHGDPDPRPIKAWLIKHLIPAVGHGLASGQWGTGKTFVMFDLAAALGTGQPFLGHAVKRQCGVLLIAAEGGDEVRLQLDAVVREKCGGMARAPSVRMAPGRPSGPAWRGHGRLIEPDPPPAAWPAHP